MIKNCHMRHENGNCLPAGGFCTANKNICEALHNAYELGRQSVQPEQKWIPCSERLPEENGQYLITIKYKHVNNSYEDIYAEHGEWLDGEWDMFCFGHCGEVEDIIAWMPLPESPYKEERDGNK